MKFCKYCGAELSDDSVFCSKCGKSLAVEPLQVEENQTIEEETIIDETKEDSLGFEEIEPSFEVQPVTTTKVVNNNNNVKREKMKFHPVAIVGFSLSIISITCSFISLIFVLASSGLSDNLGLAGLFSVISDATMLPGLITSIIGVILSKNKIFGIVGIISSALTFVISSVSSIYVVSVVGTAIASGFFNIFYYFLYGIITLFSMGLSVG